MELDAIAGGIVDADVVSVELCILLRLPSLIVQPRIRRVKEILGSRPLGGFLCACRDSMLGADIGNEGKVREGHAAGGRYSALLALVSLGVEEDGETNRRLEGSRACRRGRH